MSFTPRPLSVTVEWIEYVPYSSDEGWAAVLVTGPGFTY